MSPCQTSGGGIVVRYAQDSSTKLVACCEGLIILEFKGTEFRDDKSSFVGVKSTDAVNVPGVGRATLYAQPKLASFHYFSFALEPGLTRQVGEDHGKLGLISLNECRDRLF